MFIRMIVGYDDGSKPIIPVSAEMNISLPAILDFTIAKKCGDMIGYRMLTISGHTHMTLIHWAFLLAASDSDAIQNSWSWENL